MSEIAGAVLMVVCAVSIAPFLWEVCDRRGTLARLVPPVTPVTTSRPRAHADFVTFLSSVARSVRSGASAAQAIISAPASCAQTEGVQRLLVSGVRVAAATTGDHPHVRVLRACIHGDALSAPALDRAVTDERFRMQTQHDTAVAAAQARRSARVLTALPFVFLLFLAATSSSVREHLFSPVVGGAVTIGIVLNITGRLWMRRLVSGAVRPSPDMELASTIASVLALHVCAGGSVADCFAALAPVDPRCAEVSSMLRAGHTLATSLSPIEEVVPSVVRTVLDAHRDGLPVNDAVMRVADDLRDASAAHIRSRIAQVAVRSTTPLVLCTLPSFLLIGIAPMALAALAGLSTPTL